MSVSILIPSALRAFTDRKSEIEAEGATVGEALASLAKAYPDLKHQIYEDDTKLRGFVNVFVDGTNIKKLNGLDIVGFYHSHPDHPAAPSEYDRDHALPFYHYIILRVAQGNPEEMTDWRLRLSREAFDAENLEIKP